MSEMTSGLPMTWEAIFKQALYKRGRPCKSLARAPLPAPPAKDPI